MWKSFEDWDNQVPEIIKRSPLWELRIYRLALFLSDLAWFDSDLILQAPQAKSLSWQLVRSAGSVPANIEEGYGRGYGKDYARFLRIALGSARETQGWYYRARHTLPEDTVQHRLKLCDEVISGLRILSKKQANLTSQPTKT